MGSKRILFLLLPFNLSCHGNTELLNKKNINPNSKEPMHLNVHSSTIYDSQVLEAPKYPSVNEWIKNYGTFTQWNTTQKK